MRANSLALRLFLSATAVTVVILLVTGLVLSSYYRDAVERSFDRGLTVLLRTLVGQAASPQTAATDETGERDSEALGEPLFRLPLSGWYWQITRLSTTKPEVRSSPSLFDFNLPHLVDQGIPTDDSGVRRAYVPGPEDQRLRQLERTVDLGEDGRFLVAVAGDTVEVAGETRSFDRVILVTFITLAAVLLLTTMFQVRFGLAPLARISQGLAAIRAGTAERLAGRFP